jgi:hypothetical protein
VSTSFERVRTSERVHLTFGVSFLFQSRLLARCLRWRSEYRRRWQLAVKHLVKHKTIKEGSYTLLLDVQTRWNSTIAYVNSVIAAKLVIEEFGINISQKEWLPVDRLQAEDVALLQQITPTLAVRFSKWYQTFRRSNAFTRSNVRCSTEKKADCGLFASAFMNTTLS